jgi:hypothetical protein
LTGIRGRGDNLCFSAIPAISRAIWSAPPPVPAGITNSIGLLGSHAHTGLSGAKNASTIKAQMNEADRQVKFTGTSFRVLPVWEIPSKAKPDSACFSHRSW